MKLKMYSLFVVTILLMTALHSFAQTSSRFIIDSHQHYNSSPDYIARLVKVYRPRNAMACVLTPLAGLDVVKKAAAEH